eukprot:scaffold103635_cov78-Phaeocystis_antarctica.AAC.1
MGSRGGEGAEVFATAIVCYHCGCPQVLGRTSNTVFSQHCKYGLAIFALSLRDGAVDRADYFGFDEGPGLIGVIKHDKNTARSSTSHLYDIK